MPGYTTIRGLDGKGLALIEWQEHPLVEVRGVFSKRRTKEWLALNEERTSVDYYSALAVNLIFLR